MAVSKWLARKSFDEANVRAEQIKLATKIKNEKNAGLFTPTQEKLRQELGLHERQSAGLQSHCASCHCDRTKNVIRASRSRTPIRIKNFEL